MSRCWVGMMLRREMAVGNMYNKKREEHKVAYEWRKVYKGGLHLIQKLQKEIGHHFAVSYLP